MMAARKCNRNAFCVHAQQATCSGLVTIAHSLSFGVMPVGSLTSAIGAFETRSAARMHGLNGFVGIQIQPTGQLEQANENHSKFERLIPTESGSSREYGSLSQPQPRKSITKLRVWAGLTPGRINEALIDLLGPGHSVYLDLTTFNQAQIEPSSPMEVKVRCAPTHALTLYPQHLSTAQAKCIN